MIPQAIVHIVLVRAIRRILVERGVAKSEIDPIIGLSYQNIESFDGWLPFSIFERILVSGCDMTGEPSFALRLGESIDPLALGIIGHLLLNSKNLRQAAENWERFDSLACSVGRPSHKDSKGSFFYCFDFPREVGHQVVEFALASTLSFCRRFTGKPITPIRVSFLHEEPPYVGDYERVFGIHPLFSQNRLFMEMAAREMEYKSSHHDDTLQETLALHANDLLGEIRPERSMADRVKRAIANRLPMGSIGVETIAKECNMSRWTLNRRLREENTSYQEILEDIRRRLALDYLHIKARSTSEIAFLLGFSDPSVFSRAFKRWTGKSPTDYRRTG